MSLSLSATSCGAKREVVARWMSALAATPSPLRQWTSWSSLLSTLLEMKDLFTEPSLVSPPWNDAQVCVNMSVYSILDTLNGTYNCPIPRVDAPCERLVHAAIFVQSLQKHSATQPQVLHNMTKGFNFLPSAMAEGMTVYQPLSWPVVRLEQISGQCE